MAHLLGIDVSTTATKVILVDDAGVVRGIGTAGYRFEVPRPLWTEQAPELWWTATVSAVRQALASASVTAADVVGVGLTGQGFIQVNPRLETTAPGVWALGDVKGGPAFTHISFNDFQIVYANLIEGKRLTTDGPWLMGEGWPRPPSLLTSSICQEPRPIGHPWIPDSFRG